MFHWYLNKGDRVLFVDDAHIELDKHDKELDLKFESCRLTDVVHLSGGIYDAIIFPTMPPIGILKKAIEKARRCVFTQGIEEVVKESGCDVLRGSPKTLILRKHSKRRSYVQPEGSRKVLAEFTRSG